MSIIVKDIADYKNEFSTNGCVKLPPFFHQNFLQILSSGFSKENEKRLLLEDSSTEITITDQILYTRISIALNSPDFLNMISEFLGEKITKAKHRLYYIDNQCESLTWHDDSYAKDHRVAAIRFELSDEAYEGGDFRFRNSEKEFRFSNLKFSESVLFKIESKIMCHCVENVTQGKRKSLSIFLCR